MKLLWTSLALCALTACSGPNVRPDAQWSAYRAQVAQDQKEGKITASEAQHRLHDGWININGDDPTMAGFYAFSETLMRSAEQGRISKEEAQSLINSREKTALAEYQAVQRRRQEVAGPDYDRW